MPQKSKKSKSKRQTLKQKYKVLKKVKEHHRKKRKEEKKNGTHRKAPRDPGIPNSWPFKEELIQQLRAQKERAVAREKALRDARREALTAQAEDGGLQTMLEVAAVRGQAYETAAARTGGVAAPDGSYVDYSLKAFFKDFARVVEASDVIIEVLDARDPAGSRCLDVERFVRRIGPNKKIILLLNKIDLVPREVVEEWLKHLREELPAVAFKCSTQRQGTNLGRKQLSTTAEAAKHGSECLGAETLLHLLKNYARGQSGLKSSITVGVIGLPNVGKSSVINSLKRTRVAQVGNTPGITKSVQEVHLDRQVTLLDSPGVVFAAAGADGAAAAALRNCVKVEQMEDPVLPVAEIVKRCPTKQLMMLYKVPAFEGVDGFLTHVATARGKLKRQGVVDNAAAARIVLQDWNSGKIPYFTRPIQREAEVAGTAAVVSDWGADFDAAAVFAAEQNAVVDGLPSLQDPQSAGFFQTDTMGEAHVALDAEAAASGGEEDSMSGSEIEEEESDVDAMQEAEPVATRTRSGKATQNEQLYGQKGQFNPMVAKAERKRAKKVSSAVKEAAGEKDGNSDSDFDFETDWADAEHANAYAGLVEGEEESSEEDSEGAEDME